MRLCALLAALAAGPASAADLAEKEQEAFRAAVDRVAPCVVRIETVGGMERVEGTLFGSGPTTGLIADPAGYVLSSAFNFFNKPTSILVRLPDGSRKPAQLVATDHSRMLVLLKVEAGQPLPVPEFAPKEQMRVGQWAIAVGRAFEANRPSMSVGILSALGRVWGKAIQTDAPVSPNNYGGPLVDVQGRVLGLLVPLSPQAESEVSGVEWYDSGIGFAVPAEQIQQIVPRLMQGQDLRPGLLGISFRSRNLHTEEPVVKGSYPKSPARQAGLKEGDRIVEIDGQRTHRAAHVKQALTRHYAGDAIRLVVRRKGERIELQAVLAAELSPYQRPSLGILPMRPIGDEESQGVRVRYVAPDGPAAKAGILAGDLLQSVDDHATADAFDLQETLLSMEPEQAVKVQLQRAGKELHVQVVLGGPREMRPPAVLPPAHEAPRTEPGKQRLKVGVFQQKIPELDNEIRVYVPEAYQESVAHGVVLWLHEPGARDLENLASRWQPLCDRYDLILLAPKAADPASWKPGDLGMLRKLLVQIATDYEIDASRIAMFGQPGSGSLAFEAAFSLRDVVRGLAGVDLHWLGDVPADNPLRPLSFFLACSETGKLRPVVDRTVGRLREQNYPVSVLPLASGSRVLDDAGLAELSRWIDMLDRI